MKFEILPTEQAVALRKAFIRRFVDTTSEHYQKHIATLSQDIDGFCYDGYLWDCLHDNKMLEKECRMEDAAAFLRDKKNVFFMWDLFSKERLSGKRFSSEYPKAAVISIEGSLLSQIIVEEWNNEHDAWTSGFQCQGLWLPEDIYCFDESVSWYAIFTHEGWDGWTNPELDEDVYIRVCFLNIQTWLFGTKCPLSLIG